MDKVKTWFKNAKKHQKVAAIIGVVAVVMAVYAWLSSNGS
jgi:flagellar biosynthesis/type III secretory pathway M-ring protein FliF/YscJ